MFIQEFTKKQTNGNKLVFVKISHTEAQRLIASLATQCATNSPNSGRLESTTVDLIDFSIAVLPDKLYEKSEAEFMKK